MYILPVKCISIDSLNASAKLRKETLGKTNPELCELSEYLLVNPNHFRCENGQIRFGKYALRERDRWALTCPATRKKIELLLNYPKLAIDSSLMDIFHHEYYLWCKQPQDDDDGKPRLAPASPSLPPPTH